MLGIPPTADAQAIKQAFRREIARYHPDKVQHLGAEFQQLASVRAAELTTAYNTLSNPSLRAEYDAACAVAPEAARPATPPPEAPPATVAEPVPERAAAAHETASASAAPAVDRFHRDRVDRDGILRRAVLARVHECFADGDYEAPVYGGFDLALVPRSRSPVFRRVPRPSVLVRTADRVDGALVLQAWTDALRARIAAKPVVLLLLARDVDRRSVADMVADRRERHPNVAEAIFPVAVNMRDWSAEVPSHAPESVRAAIDRLRNFTS